MLPAAELTDAQWGEVQRLERTAWPKPAEPQHRGPDPAMDPVALLLRDEEVLVASLFVLTKDITHAGERYRASGLRAVVTDPARRRQGWGLQLVRAAHELVRDRGDDLMLFTCDRELVPFYERGGVRELPGTVVLGGTPEEPLRSDAFDKVAVASLLSERARARAEDFEQAEIALYPGLREKLW